MRRVLWASAVLALMGSGAFATVESDALIRDLASKGFTRIEVREGLTQMKVVAIRGKEKLELVLDGTSGKVLKQTTSKVWFVDNTDPGFFVSERNRDFLTAPSATVARSDSDGTPILRQQRSGGTEAGDGPTGALALVDPNRVMEGYEGPAIDVAPEGDGLDIELGDPIDLGDGIGDGLPLEGDDQLVFIDDGWGIAIGEIYPIDTVWDVLPYEDDGVLIGDDGLGGGDIIVIDDGWVDDGTGDDGWVDDGTGDDGTGDDGWVDDGTGDDGWVDDGTGEDGWVDDGTGEDRTGDDGTGTESGDAEVTIQIEPMIEMKPAVQP